MKLIVPLALFSISAGAADLNQLTPAERDQGYQLLFDGKTLKGWQGDPRLWSVEDGAIVGSSDQHEVDVNTFLIYERPFADFVLKIDVRLRNGNSGIQFRSEHKPGPGWIVHGYQADFSDAGERSAWGNFYEEKGRGRAVMETPDQGWQAGKTIYRKRDWNQYEIRADGDRIKLTLNGKVTFDGVDSKTSGGVVAIQLHSGPSMRVECRNIRIKPLR